MIDNVCALLEASHTVRLWLGRSEEGIRNGNNAMPAVKIVQVTVRLLARKAAL